MKVSLAVTVDDTQKIYESHSNHLMAEDGSVDITAIQWNLYGMLVDAILKLKVSAVDPKDVASPLQGEP